MQQEDCHQSGYRPGEEERLSIFANPVLTIADQRLHPRASPTVAIGTSLDLSLQPVQLHVTLYQLAVVKYSKCSIYIIYISITLPLPRSKLAGSATHSQVPVLCPCLREFKRCGGSHSLVRRTIVVPRLWTPLLLARPGGKKAFRILGCWDRSQR